MEISIRKVEDTAIAEITDREFIVRSSQDALDVMGNADYQGARKIILHQRSIDQAFFDLRSGIAGDVLQKFVNYQMQLAIVGDFSSYMTPSFRAFMVECNRGSHIFFVNDVPEATGKLTHAR